MAHDASADHNAGAHHNAAPHDDHARANDDAPADDDEPMVGGYDDNSHAHYNSVFVRRGNGDDWRPHGSLSRRAEVCLS